MNMWKNLVLGRHKCPRCKSKGAVMCRSCTGKGVKGYVTSSKCGKCKGSGEVQCSNCEGKGFIKK